MRVTTVIASFVALPQLSQSPSMTYHGNPPASTVLVRPPRHPVPQLQGPFEESMLESAHDDADMEVFLDPVARRNTMLEAPIYTRVVAGRWKQKPGEKYHPLWKLVAQISFGVHLLSERMAKSEDDVMQILQSHVDEIDGFLERTTEDFNLAKEDIEERLRCLALPLSHPATFDKMLEDRDFRLSIVEGNEKIEHIVDRTSQAMKDQLKDVQKGYDSSLSLEKYLHGLSLTWQRTTVEHEAVFVAMLGNVEGWRKAFMDLHMQGSKLGSSIRKLTEIINQMQARAGEVSRRMLHQARGYSSTHSGTTPHQAMGRPSGRGTPVSRYQSLPPGKYLPQQPDRSTLQSRLPDSSIGSGQAQVSNLLNSRSTTPQNAMPAPQNINATATPLLIQPPADESARVQSMVPSLLELPSAPIERTLGVSLDQTPTKSFAAVELPADVPEETLRALPISKQNRLSMGLGLLPSSKEKRLSKVQLPTTALVDLLRTNPAAKQEQTNYATPTSKRSPFSSRRGSVQRSNSITGDDPNRQRMSLPRNQESKTASLPAPITSGFTKNNVRRPKKGAQHWFDALDDDSEDEKFSVMGDNSPHVSTSHLIVTTSKPVSEQGSHPGTPSWAVNTFEKAEQRKALLRQGAFNSHPPTLPPGSPPMDHGPLLNNFSGGGSARTSSHESGSKTTGEPGPEISQSSPVTSLVPLRQQLDVRASKRASAVAPEVVVERKPAPVPSTSKVFAAELEGSTPVTWNAGSKATSIVMELEAPQQYFKLPPRPTKHNSSDGVIKISGSHSLLVSETSTDSQKAGEKTESAAGTNKASGHDYQHETASPTVNQEEKDSVDEWDVVGDYIDTETIGSINTDEKSQVMQTVYDKYNTKVPTPQIPLPPSPSPDSESYKKGGGEESQRQNISTPQIPLPPSPNETESETKSVNATSSHEQLFLLPAVAYKAPARQSKPKTTPLQTSGDKISQLPSGLPVRDRGSPVSVDPISLDSKVESGTLGTNHSALTSPAARGPKTVERLSTQGNTNQWKAFFRGEASPVDSNLSIRNIKGHSTEPKSPPEAKSSMQPSSTTNESGGSMMTSGGKDVLWFNKADASDINSTESSGKGEISGNPGLGIMTA